MEQPWWSDLISFVFRASTSPEKKSTQNTKFFGQQNEGKVPSMGFFRNSGKAHLQDFQQKSIA